MQRRVISRLFLCLLLLWQLGAGAWLHAAPMGTPSFSASAAHADSCAGHPHLRISGHTGGNSIHTGTHHHTPPVKDSCCAHSGSLCDCTGNALMSAPVEKRQVTPNHPIVIDFAAPLVERRVDLLFRPPI